MHLICDNLATHKTPAINTWLAAIHASTCTSPRPARPGSTRSNAGSATSPTNSSAAACTNPCRHWRKTSATGSRSGTKTRNHSPGPRPPKRSSTPSPDISHEFLTQDTSGDNSKIISVEEVAVSEVGSGADLAGSVDRAGCPELRADPTGRFVQHRRRTRDNVVRHTQSGPDIDSAIGRGARARTPPRNARRPPAHRHRWRTRAGGPRSRSANLAGAASPRVFGAARHAGALQEARTSRSVRSARIAFPTSVVCGMVRRPTSVNMPHGIVGGLNLRDVDDRSPSSTGEVDRLTEGVDDSGHVRGGDRAHEFWLDSASRISRGPSAYRRDGSCRT